MRYTCSENPPTVPWRMELYALKTPFSFRHWSVVKLQWVVPIAPSLVPFWSHSWCSSSCSVKTGTTGFYFATLIVRMLQPDATSLCYCLNSFLCQEFLELHLQRTPVSLQPVAFANRVWYHRWESSCWVSRLFHFAKIDGWIGTVPEEFCPLLQVRYDFPFVFCIQRFCQCLRALQYYTWTI